MRMAHTSDCHQGEHFMGKSRQAEHQALIDWLLIQVDEHAVLIAGGGNQASGSIRTLLARLLCALWRPDTSR
jgi:hypothetical protein